MLQDGAVGLACVSDTSEFVTSCSRPADFQGGKQNDSLVLLHPVPYPGAGDKERDAPEEQLPGWVLEPLRHQGFLPVSEARRVSVCGTCGHICIDFSSTENIVCDSPSLKGLSFPRYWVLQRDHEWILNCHKCF